MSVKVKNLSKTYGSQVAVNDISFDIEKGSITGFLGPNGAGKSTTMKMITGYVQPDAGTITVDNIPVITGGTESKKRIGYLPEINPMYTDMYVREYLGFVCGVQGVKNKKEAIEQVIATVGLTPEAHKKTGQLSKGYKQRVGLAAALVHSPSVLILDEPTSGLDPNQIIEIRNVIRSLAKDKTILLSSHIMQEVEAICDRAIIIHKGNIVADDAVDNLRHLSSAPVVQVRFDRELDPAILKNMEGVRSVKKQSDGSFWLETDNADTVRRSILNMSVKEGLNIETLQSQVQSLESVFASLTAK